MGDHAEDQVISRDALALLRTEFDTFEKVQREQTTAMRSAIEKLQDSHEEIVTRVDDHAVKLVDHTTDLRLLKTTMASTDSRLGRIESLLASTPRRTLVAAGAPPALWLLIEFLNWLRTAQ